MAEQPAEELNPAASTFSQDPVLAEAIDAMWRDAEASDIGQAQDNSSDQGHTVATSTGDFKLGAGQTPTPTSGQADRTLDHWHDVPFQLGSTGLTPRQASPMQISPPAAAKNPEENSYNAATSNLRAPDGNGAGPSGVTQLQLTPDPTPERTPDPARALGQKQQYRDWERSRAVTRAQAGTPAGTSAAQADAGVKPEVPTPGSAPGSANTTERQKAKTSGVRLPAKVVSHEDFGDTFVESMNRVSFEQLSLGQRGVHNTSSLWSRQPGSDAVASALSSLVHDSPDLQSSLQMRGQGVPVTSLPIVQEAFKKLHLAEPPGGLGDHHHQQQQQQQPQQHVMSAAQQQQLQGMAVQQPMQARRRYRSVDDPDWGPWDIPSGSDSASEGERSPAAAAQGPPQHQQQPQQPLPQPQQQQQQLQQQEEEEEVAEEEKFKTRCTANASVKVLGTLVKRMKEHATGVEGQKAELLGDFCTAVCSKVEEGMKMKKREDVSAELDLDAVAENDEEEWV